MQLKLSSDTLNALSLVIDYAYDRMADDSKLNKNQHTELLLAIDHIEKEFPEV